MSVDGRTVVVMCPQSVRIFSANDEVVYSIFFVSIPPATPGTSGLPRAGTSPGYRLHYVVAGTPCYILRHAEAVLPCVNGVPECT